MKDSARGREPQYDWRIKELYLASNKTWGGKKIWNVLDAEGRKMTLRNVFIRLSKIKSEM